MRYIGTLNNESDAIKLSYFLSEKNINHHVEVPQNNDWGSDAYGQIEYQFWIDEEDQVDTAVMWMNQFLENPQAPIFQRMPPPPPTESSVNPESEISTWEKTPMGTITKALILICCLLFIATEFTTPTITAKRYPLSLPIFLSPIEKNLLFDYPKTYELISSLIDQYGYTAIETPKELPEEGRMLIKQINQTPYWQGLYDYTLEGKLGQISNVPKFEKIDQGELWRLFTPCLLHGSLLHIFFNMFWLVILGKQLESRLRTTRYIAFILITGITANIAQYIMSGPNFLGISGVIAGMIGFIWIRQRSAPWEGYQLDRATLIFISAFILGIAALQVLLFIMQFFFQVEFSAGVANTAHLVGAATGITLGKLSFFKWK